MRRWFAYIVLLMASFMTMHAVVLTSNDPYWIGNDATYGTTEDTDFWLTFMRNGGNFSPETSPNIIFELKIAVSARQATTVHFAIGNTDVHTHALQAGETYVYDVSDQYAQIYLMESEMDGVYKGVHVYTEEDGHAFSCFNYSRFGEAGVSSRDASLIIPTKYMGKEYYVQTYYEDAYSSEFAVVATEDNTEVFITPSYQTLGGHAANQQIPVTLEKAGDAYLVASALHQGNNIKVDLSGSKICADKPVAVFNGNQETSIPFHESNSVDYLGEQILPITQWGKDFYLAKLGSTKLNYTILTAAYNDTHVDIEYYMPGVGTGVRKDTLHAGESTEPLAMLESDGIEQMVIHSDLPIMCYYYTTSGGQNRENIGTPFSPNYINYGDPANALMPSWAHRARSMNFFTHDMDPYVAPGKQEPPKKYLVYLVTSKANKGNISVDGVTIPAADYTDFQNDPSMSYVSYLMPSPLATDYHTVESSGEGFAGMVYAVTDAQGYFYTLGYTPDPFRDSLFVTNSEHIMSPDSYDLPRISQGWYQRQWEEWMPSHERLDTAIVCDGTEVKWMVQTPVVKNAEPVDWYIYDVTGTEPTIFKPYENPEETRMGANHDGATESDWLYHWSYVFHLPDESDLEPELRTPFMDYEVHAVLHKQHEICELPDEMDTIRTVVRVTRVYHDTIFKNICMGDTLPFFFDSLPNQGNLNIRGTHADSTLFIADKTDGESTDEWTWKARPGENIYHRDYQTRYGCDSSFTLFLFVCDTFRIIDTVHLCVNEKVSYPAGASFQTTYKGIEATGDGKLVTQDTVDVIETKTRFCPCQLDPRYPPFEGCDSLFELHIFLHQIYRDTLVDTMCYNRNPDSVYIWPIQNNTQQKLITKNTPGMEYDSGLQAWIGYFSDTLRTTSCPECNNGRGCDSIQVLKLIIPQAYYFEEEAEMCAWTFDPVTRVKTPNIYKWLHHRNGANYVELPDAGEYYDSLQTRYGCDSIYHLTLIYHEPLFETTRTTIPNNQTYTWRGTTYGPYLDIENDTVFYYYDIRTDSHGCQEVYELELHIANTYLFRETKDICDNDSAHWRGRVIVGRKWNGTDPFDVRLGTQRTTDIFDSLLTIELPQRDSVYMLAITQYPTYNKTLARRSFCQTETGFQWTRQDNGQLIQDIVFPVKDHYPFDTVYEATLSTMAGLACDSVLRLPITIHPTYDTLVVDSVCEENMPYLWVLQDKDGDHSKTISLPLDKKGTVWHYTAQETLSSVAGCDSVIRLDLKVKPTVDTTIVRTVCYEELPVIFGNGKEAHAAGTFRDTMTSVRYGCDSLITLVLSVHEEIRDTLHVYRCDNGPAYSYTAEDAPNLQNLTEAGLYEQIFITTEGCKRYLYVDLSVRMHTLNDTTIYVCAGDAYLDPDTHESHDHDTTYIKTLVNAALCDSIVTTHVLRCDTFNIPAEEYVICETETDWSWHVSDTYGSYTVNVPIRDLHQVPLDTMLTDTLHTVCPARCDSIVHRHLVVKPILRQTKQINLCPEMTPYTYGVHGKTASETGIYKDTTTSVQYGCDSITTYDIFVSEEIRTVIDTFVCDNERPYNHPTENNHFMGLTETGIYYDTIRHAGVCDSILELHLEVRYHTVNDTTIYICAGDAYVDPDTHESHDHDTTYVKTLTNAALCDSIVTTHVLRCDTFNIPAVEEVKCETDPDWSWHVSDTYGSYTVNVPIRDLQQVPLDTMLTYTLHTACPARCDSVVHQHLVVKSVLRKTLTLNLCPEMTPYSYGVHGKTASETGIYNDTTTSVQYGCDSITTYDIFVSEEIRTVIDTFVCDNERPYNHPTENNHFMGLTETGIYYDTIRHAGVCDSILELHLEVRYHTVNDTTIYICAGDAYADPDTHESHDHDTTYVKALTNAVLCDSIVTTHVIRCDTFNIPAEDHIICETETDWSWHISDTYGSYTVDVPIRDLHQVPLDTMLTDTLHTACPARCDSIVHRHLVVKPILRQTIHPVVCPESLPYKSNPNGKEAYVSGIYNDTLTSLLYGCDSVLTVDLTVLEKLITPLYIERCDNELPYNHPTENIRLTGLTETGIYYDTITSHLSGCDSILELHFQVWPTYENDQYEYICDNELFDFHGHVFEHMTAQDTPYRFDSILPTIHGCDSMIHLYLTVYPTYSYLQDTLVCQDTVNVAWTWTDEFGGVHDLDISIAEAGDYVFGDTLPTIHGCDSVFGIRIHVSPIYRFDSTYVICEDERVTWQGRGYSGDKYGWGFERLNGDRYDTHRDSVYYHYVLGDSILTPGIYYDTAHYTTVEGCDSIFYMQLTVHPAGHYLQEELACDNDKFHVFYSSDAYGEHTDTVFFDRTTRMINETQRDTMFFEVERRLTALNGGCDSTIHFHLTVHPSYEFVTRAKVCWEDTYEWRGNSYFSAGVYYDSIAGGTDYWGCDSVYVLELYKKPVSLVPIYDTICDDVTYQHVDTMWYTNGTHTYVETMVWKPGMTIPQSYTDVIFKGADGCDSIIYRYFLTINPTYVVHDTATLCSNDTYTTGEHTFSGHEVEFDTDRYILPFDTLITDVYQSIHGCDSIYHLHATMYPAYRHIDTLMVCDDGEVTWRDHTLRGSMFGDVLGDGYPAGEHIVRDSFQTVLDCDSIYELHLMVQPTYLFVDSLTKCADDTLTWRSFNLDHLPAGDHFIPDSLTTIGFGCDSVYHLYITVLDTTYEVRHDTVCRSEVYDLHGVEISEPGYYKDTTLNEWGCNHFTYLYLEVIEPTIPTAWADSICADDNAYELYCTYTGRDPIGFSLYYSNEAHIYGFEDIVDSTIYDVRELYPLTLPMPRVDEDRKNYPKPDFYDIRLVLDNGICTNPDLCATDTAIVLSYPSWITRQRFGDVIALYNEDYNGGYQWDHYQWYHNGEELIGETHEYLYVPTGLIVGDRYHVRLTRTGETQDFQTCPITIIDDPVYDDFAPTMGYLSVVPTCIDVDYPHAYILSRKDGTYRVSDPNGRLVTSGEFHADVTEVILPSVDGMYIFQLWSPQTPEEPYRAIKVIVSESCPSYDMPF